MQKNTLRVILVDDDKDEHYIFREALRQLDFPIELLVLEDCDLLLDYLSVNYVTPPDVLFLDYVFPGKNGSECISEIKSRSEFREFPIVVYSNFISTPMRETLFGQGIYDCIPKQDFGVLVKTLNGIFDGLTNEKELIAASSSLNVA